MPPQQAAAGWIPGFVPLQLPIVMQWRRIHDGGII
jgi:hypothetical protein